jgi:hypothetical protein
MPARISACLRPFRALPVLLWIAVSAFAYAAKPRPAFVVPVEFDAKAVPPEGQGVNGLYWLLLDEQDDIGSRTRYYRNVCKVVSESGLQSASRLSVDYAPSYESVEFHRIAVWRKTGVRDLLPLLQPSILHREQDLEASEMLDGRKTALFTLEDIRVGDVVEYEYSLRGENPIFKGKASGTGILQYAFPVERTRFRLVHPLDAKVFLSRIDGAPSGTVNRSGNDWIREWDSIRPAAMEYDNDAPSWLLSYPRVQWSGFETWPEVVGWALDMYPFDQPLSPALTHWAQRHKLLPRRDRIRAALRLVQDSVRYLGLEMGESSHKPASPSVVYARRFGDCKDKVYLFCALLRSMDVYAAPALVNTVSRERIAKFQPSPRAFDHVIAKVPDKGETFWFDATLQGLRGDPFLNQSLPFRKALVVDKGSTGLEDIELRPGSRGKVEITQAIEAKRWDTAATMTVTSVYTGGEAEEIRAGFRDGDRQEIAKSYRDFYAAGYPGLRIDKPLEFKDEPDADRAVLTEYYAVDSLCETESATGRTACSLYPRDIANLVSAPDRKVRTSDYALSYPKNVHEVITLTTPETISLTSEERYLDHEDFRFWWNESSGHGRVKLEYEYTALSDHVPVERFGTYLERLKTINDNLGATVYPETGFLGNPNYLMIFFSLACVAAGIWGGWRLLRMERESPIRANPFLVPRPISGLLFLLALGLLARPFIFLWQGSGISELLDQGSWNALTTKGTGQYHPMWAPVLLFETAGIIVNVCLSFALLPLFFQRRSTFPRAFTITMGIAFGTEVLGMIGDRFIPAVGDSVDSPATFARSTLIGLGWIAYLYKSVTAQETFVHPLPAVEAAPADGLPTSG